MSHCAIIYKIPPQAPLSDQEATAIISRIEQQNREVSSFYSHGRLLVKNWKWESEANILIIGIKHPFKMKIEITHPWGQPILHVLIVKKRLQALSFSDNKLYLGTFTPEALSKFLPGNFNSDMIWTALRGYPVLLRYDKVLSLKANQIRLFNKEEEEIEIIDFYTDSRLPKFVTFPERHIKLALSDFRDNEGIVYAREVKVDPINRIGTLTIKSRKMVFNKVIPEQIFVIRKPPGFETVYLDEGRNGTHQ